MSEIRGHEALESVPGFDSRPIPFPYLSMLLQLLVPRCLFCRKNSTSPECDISGLYLTLHAIQRSDPRSRRDSDGGEGRLDSVLNLSSHNYSATRDSTVPPPESCHEPPRNKCLRVMAASNYQCLLSYDEHASNNSARLRLPLEKYWHGVTFRTTMDLSALSSFAVSVCRRASPNTGSPKTHG